MFEKFLDIFMFRIGTEEEADGSATPIITPGSITWGILMRTAIMVVIAAVVLLYWDGSKVSFAFLIIIWIVAIYPGFQQFQVYDKRLDKITEETMCGSCRYFDETGQLCRIYDEHITKQYIPCDGQNWELKDDNM